MKFEHEQRLRVRYAETDQMGVVYYANYLTWFEVGRVEYCRAIGVLYDEMEKAAKCFLAVVEANCRYHEPLTYDTEFVIRTRLTHFKGVFLAFGYRLLNLDGSGPLAVGWTKHIVVGQNGKPKKIPHPYAGLLKSGTPAFGSEVEQV